MIENPDNRKVEVPPQVRTMGRANAFRNIDLDDTFFGICPLREFHLQQHFTLAPSCGLLPIMLKQVYVGGLVSEYAGRRRQVVLVLVG